MCIRGVILDVAAEPALLVVVVVVVTVAGMLIVAPPSSEAPSVPVVVVVVVVAVVVMEIRSDVDVVAIVTLFEKKVVEAKVLIAGGKM